MNKCKVEGCENPAYIKHYCNRHYLHIKRHGRILSRTKYDPNPVRIEGGVAYITLCGNKGDNVRAIAIIDAEDVEKIRRYRWSSSNGRYALHVKSKLYMHHVVLGYKPNNHRIHIDHINNNGMDNRKVNLRICTNSQNAIRAAGRVGTSEYKGVSWDRTRNKWAANIGCNGMYYRLGRFNSEKEAALVYNEKAKELFGDYAYLNGVN